MKRGVVVVIALVVGVIGFVAGSVLGFGTAVRKGGNDFHPMMSDGRWGHMGDFEEHFEDMDPEMREWMESNRGHMGGYQGYSPHMMPGYRTSFYGRSRHPGGGLLALIGAGTGTAALILVLNDRKKRNTGPLEKIESVSESKTETPASE